MNAEPFDVIHMLLLVSIALQCFTIAGVVALLRLCFPPDPMADR
jgi:hypothetical protein